MIDNNEPVNLGSLTDSIIASDITLNSEEEKVIEVRIWLDISTPNSEIGKTFTGKITTDGVGEQAPEPLQLDISKGSITIEHEENAPTYASGGGLSEQVEMDNTTQIEVTGNGPSNSINCVNWDISTNITLNNAQFSNMRNTCDSINLNVEGESTISSGIHLSTSSTLIIDGTGILNAIGQERSGIGNSDSSPTTGRTGTIIINGGTINASSEGSGAGIGGRGFELIEINGGKITAIGGTDSSLDVGRGFSGAGIGTSSPTSWSSGGIIRINGGTVYAKGGMASAGIGGGFGGLGICANSDMSDIYISDNANVTAISGDTDQFIELNENYGYGYTLPQDIGDGGISC